MWGNSTRLAQAHTALALQQRLEQVSVPHGHTTCTQSMKQTLPMCEGRGLRSLKTLPLRSSSGFSRSLSPMDTPPAHKACTNSVPC
jgi:hypothetical protein